jgi:hypothetical protein
LKSCRTPKREGGERVLIFIEMKKILFFALLIFSFSCKKDSFITNESNLIQLFEIGNEADYTLFEDKDVLFKANLKMKLSAVISSLINENDSIKNMLLHEFVLNNFEEVLINDLFNSVLKPSNYLALNEAIVSLFPNDNVHLLDLVNGCSLLSLYLPKEEYGAISNNLDNLIIPVRSVNENDDKAYSFFYQYVAEDDNNIGVILRESQMYSLYDINQDNIEYENVSFNEFYSFNITECSAISSYVSSQPSCNGKKILNNLTIQKKYRDCFPVRQPILTSTELDTIRATPRNGYCHRAELELDLIYPELNQNITNFGYLRLANRGAFFAIDNQALPSSVFIFEIDYVIGRDGEPWGELKRIRFTVARNELVDIKIEEEYVGGVSIFGIKLFANKKTYTVVTPKAVPISIEVFSKTPQHRHWRINNQGDAFWLNIMERKSQNSSSTSQQSETVTTTIGANLGFSIPVINSNGGINFQNQYTRSNIVTITKTGVGFVDLGNTFFEYCEPYPNIDLSPLLDRWRWLQDRSTGSIEIWLDSYWLP